MSYNQLLSVFNLKKVEKTIFSLLVEHGSLKVGEVAKLTNTNRTSTYDYLEDLLEKGLVNQTQKGEVKVFTVQTPEKIKFILTEQKEKISIAQNSLEQLEKAYKKKAELFKPKLTLYEGKEELRQMMKDVLLYNDITVLAYWPIKNILDTLGVDFFKEFQEKRLKNNIYLKTIWPPNQIPDLGEYPFLKPSPELKREVRTTNKNTDFPLGYTIYNNTVRFLSSAKENYGFLIESYEFAKTMKSQFNAIWDLSKDITKTKKQ